LVQGQEGSEGEKKRGGVTERRRGGYTQKRAQIEKQGILGQPKAYVNKPTTGG